jgi:hypothetical protein
LALEIRSARHRLHDGLTPNSQPDRITPGPDRNLWFTESANPGRIGRITPTGTITEFTAGLTPDSTPVGITAGPDANLWFTENAKPGRIAKIGGGCVPRRHRLHHPRPCPSSHSSLDSRAEVLYSHVRLFEPMSDRRVTSIRRRTDDLPIVPARSGGHAC